MANYESGSRAADKFVVRMPAGMRGDVEQESIEADRSMNAVFIQAVKEYLNGRQRKKALIDVLERAAEVGQTNSADGARKVLGQLVAIGDMGVNEARRLIASVDEVHVNQISETGDNVNQHIDERIKEAAADPVFLTVVFKLPNAQAAGALVNQLPYGQLALGTQARVHGMTTGNLMEGESCAD